MFGHEICLKGRLDTFSRFSAFKIHNSVSLWVKITRKPNGMGRPSWCITRKQSSNSATGCDVINQWIIGTRNKYRALLESWAPPAWFEPLKWYCKLNFVYKRTPAAFVRVSLCEKKACFLYIQWKVYASCSF